MKELNMTENDIYIKRMMLKEEYILTKWKNIAMCILA